MAAIAHHRGWTVVVHGEADFRREEWLGSERPDGATGHVA